MDLNISDLVILAVVLWIVFELMNNGNWGSGHRSRTDHRVAVPVGCAV